MLRREEVEAIREKYPAGTKIRLHCMEGEMQMPPGLEGTVSLVDDIGQIHMKWENGSSLALNTELDSFSIIEPEEQTAERKIDEHLACGNVQAMNLQQ